MTLYQKFKNLKIDHAAIGLRQQKANDTTYFCTPEGAKIIGWEGVDGIHYCFIRGFGEMVFAVNPSNAPGDYAHPIARNFEDLLCLLLSCGSMDAIEQAHMWDETTFYEYVKENQPGTEERAAMDVIKESLSITPMEKPFHYIKDLQAGFDGRRIRYPHGYCDENADLAAEKELPLWKVFYDGGFWKEKGLPGREVSVRKSFRWGQEHWVIPAIYICREGLVVDFCLEAEAETLKDYLDKWNLHCEDRDCSKEQRERMENENPLHAEFTAKAIVNGETLKRKHGSGLFWLPESCLADKSYQDEKARQVLEHYGLDLNNGWAINRYSFPWAAKRPIVIKLLRLRMERSPANIPGVHLRSPAVGNRVTFKHPVTGLEHTLTVHEYETQQMEQGAFHDDNVEYPTHYTAMTYTLFPDIANGDFRLEDCAESDRPRSKNSELEQPGAIAVGLIGITKNTEITLENGASVHPHAAVSSLHFDPKPEIEWRMTFCQKMMEDLEVTLIEKEQANGGEL